MLQIDRNQKLEKIKSKIEEKVRGSGRHEKPKIETKTKERVQTRNNKTQPETQAMLNGNERRDLKGERRRGAGSREGQKEKVCVTTCVRRNKNNL